VGEAVARRVGADARDGVFRDVDRDHVAAGRGQREDGGYVTPVECVGEYATYVSRIREDSTVDNGLSLWVVSDNLRKGAALNAVQIAELLGRKHLRKAA
jgi:aspartate-semialdehyde dehydrogenase